MGARVRGGSRVVLRGLKSQGAGVEGEPVPLTAQTSHEPERGAIVRTAGGCSCYTRYLSMGLLDPVDAKLEHALLHIQQAMNHVPVFHLKCPRLLLLLLIFPI